MECVDDELSPAQLKAIKEAQKEHEKVKYLELSLMIDHQIWEFFL
jgi:hypothetical protein